MRFVLDHTREIVGVTTVASSAGHTITSHEFLEHRAKVLVARLLHAANVELANA